MVRTLKFRHCGCRILEKDLWFQRLCDEVECPICGEKDKAFQFYQEISYGDPRLSFKEAVKQIVKEENEWGNPVLSQSGEDGSKQGRASADKGRKKHNLTLSAAICGFLGTLGGLVLSILFLLMLRGCQ